MKKMNHYFGLSLIAFGISGCGQPAPAPAPAAAPAAAAQTTSPPTGSCQTGQYKLGALCINATTFADACRLGAGTMVNGTGGVQMCRVEYSALSFYNGSFTYPFQGTSFPVLLEDVPTAGTAWSTGVPVYAGDQLFWSASGGWGKATTSGRVFTWTTVNCTDVSLSGIDDGVTLMNNTLPKELLGTDGTNVYPLGSTASPRFTTDGTFAFGFNIPNVDYNYCSTLSISRATIRHCEDSSHHTYPCP